MNNRSQRPTSKAFQEFMASSWATDTSQLPEQDAAAPFAVARRAKLSENFVSVLSFLPAH